VANERILVVDDEKGVVRSCVRILERQGFIATGRTDSESVPELLKQETFDLLLTDIKMPRLDGLELLQLAKGIDPHLTVVLITGYGTMEDAINAIRLGAEGFIMKPFEPADLIEIIKENLARRSLKRDSLRLQTLLPLLEINQTLQGSDGETSLVRHILEIGQRETGAARLVWLSCQSPAALPFAQTNEHKLVEMAVVPSPEPTADEASSLTSWLPKESLDTILNQAHPVWVLVDGTIVDKITGQANIAGALFPLMSKGEVVGILTAETGETGRSGPFDPISLDLLAVIAGQLSIIIENVQLFKQTEALRAFNEDIIQNMTNGLIAIDRNKSITAFNPAAATMLGCAPHQVLNRPIQEVMAGAKILEEIFDETLQTGQAHRRQEVLLDQKKGAQLSISVSTAPLAIGDRDDEPAGVVGVLEDLSEIKALEAERRQLDRLAALGEMSAVVAHEIRNPVAGIAAGIEYLARHIPKGSDDFTGITMIQGEIERVNRILEDILFVARPLKLNLSDENLSELLQNVIQRCQPQIKQSQIEVSFQDEVDLPRLKVDRQRLEQVFTNLIINATQAMPHGGQLLLQTSLNCGQNEETPQEVVITVTDTGPGIPVETHRRIFEPFFTTKIRGTGLGLPVARRIIEQHQGSINIEQQKKGARFVITLPVAGPGTGPGTRPGTRRDSS
jgi:PAS domain S-box-containing protein